MPDPSGLVRSLFLFPTNRPLFRSSLDSPPSPLHFNFLCIPFPRLIILPPRLTKIIFGPFPPFYILNFLFFPLFPPRPRPLQHQIFSDFQTKMLRMAHAALPGIGIHPSATVQPKNCNPARSTPGPPPPASTPGFSHDPPTRRPPAPHPPDHTKLTPWLLPPRT